MFWEVFACISHFSVITNRFLNLIDLWTVSAFAWSSANRSGYCFHPWCPDGLASGGKKFVRAVSQKPLGVGS